jgi:hypothetical protein
MTMESEEREQELEEAQDDAEAGAQRMEDQASELGDSIDDARAARDNAEEEQRIAGTGGPDQDSEQMGEDPPAPAQEPPGDGD